MTPSAVPVMEQRPVTTTTWDTAEDERANRPIKKIKLDVDQLSLQAEAEGGDSDDVVAIPSHPLGVKPAGNAYTAVFNHKPFSGYFAVLPDELLMQFLEYLGAAGLVALGQTCKALYAFTRADELWRSLFVESPPPNFEWQGTWRSTYLNLPPTAVSQIQCPHLFSDILHRPFYCAHTPLKRYAANIPSQNQIPRLNDLTHAEFSTNWTDRPFILTSPVKEWPVYGAWTPESLLEQFPDIDFRAEAVDWPMRKYMAYMRNSSDESPLYLFDRAFVEKTGVTVGRQKAAAPTDPVSSSSSPAYWSPDCFGDDLFALLGDQRPDSRWMIMGPERSGSTFHKDPNATSAWNAVLTGSKYWLMFPSSSGTAAAAAALPPPPGVIVSADGSEVTSPLSIAEYLEGFHALARRTPGCQEAVCRAGEVLHVPSGWFHLVLNLEGGLALTQNFVPRARLGDVLAFLHHQPANVSGFREEVVADPFGLFVERLRAACPDVLEQGLRDMDRVMRGKKGKWEKLVHGDEDGEDGVKEGEGFSFGFGFGSDDEAEVP